MAWGYDIFPKNIEGRTVIEKIRSDAVGDCNGGHAPANLASAKERTVFITNIRSDAVGGCNGDTLPLTSPS